MAITAYDGLFSLLVFAVFLFPAVILGLRGYKLKYYGMIISLPLLYMLAGLKIKAFLGFLTAELIIILIYYYGRQLIETKYFYYIMLGLSILPLIYVKAEPYTKLPVMGFMGISYMGFRIWQLIIEIHDDHIKNIIELHNDRLERFEIWKIIYFITFFPTLQSGPIDRWQRFSDDIETQYDGAFYRDEFLLPGLKKICRGIVYKFAFANFINVFWLLKIPVAVTLWRTVQYMYGYTLYLFFDFAGYSCMAIGTAYILGIRAPENFNLPFLSRNMKEFWERWHISLSKWFGDYLFSRVVLNLLRGKYVKTQKAATRIGYMVTMLTMGAWHGFTVCYLLYGLYQGIALVLTDVWLKSKTYRKMFKKPYYNLVSRVICFHVIAVGLLIFSGYLIKF